MTSSIPVRTTVRWIGRHWRVWAGTLGLIVIVLWAGGACREKVAPGKLDREPGFALPASAAVIVVSNEMVAARIDVVGTVQSEERIHLSARFPAYVKEVFVSAGDAVTPGQVLIALDDREIREQLIAAEARLQQARAEFERARRLLETKATTEQAFDAAETGYKAARADVDRVKVMLTYASITSPIDGVITDRRIEAGDLADPGRVLLAVYDPSSMRLEAPVPMRLIERLKLGEVVDVVLDRPPASLQGRVTEIVSEVDPASRTQMVKIRLQDAGGGVLPGTFGRAWVEETAHPAVLLPQSAVYRVGQLEFVQVVRNGRVLKRLVKTGPVYGSRTEVISGLEPGVRVLADPVKGE